MTQTTSHARGPIRPDPVCGRCGDAGLADGDEIRSLLILLLAASTLGAQQMEVRLNTDTTKAKFLLGDVLHTVHGTFKLTKGDLWFDPSSCKAGGTLVVNGAIGESGSHARDSRMKK